jgi:hypothetical protein
MSLFASHVVHSVHHVTCPSHIDKAALSELEHAALNWPKLPAQIHLLDFRNVKKVDPEFFHAINRITIQLQLTSNARLASVNLNDEITKLAEKSGADKSLGIIKNPLAVNKNATPKVDMAEVQLWMIRYFIEATRAAMNIMFNTTVAADENYRYPVKKFQTQSVHVASGVELKNDFIHAHLRLYFPQNCLESLTRSSISLPPCPIDPEILNSTATEMLNIIYGGSKSRLNDERNFKMPECIPQLLSNDMLDSLRQDRLDHLILLPLATALGTFYMEIDIRN